MFDFYGYFANLTYISWPQIFEFKIAFPYKESYNPKSHMT